MTLAQIIRLALCQLDEDPADIAEYEERFRMYANDGYHIIQREYLKPVETFPLRTDGDGLADISAFDIVEIVSVKDESGRSVFYEKAADGMAIRTDRRKAELRAVCQISYPPMDSLTEEPRIPEHAHSALVDYICFRHLSTGNLAKQSRAQAFQNSFYTGVRRIRSANRGSVTRMSGLYAASDIRRGW